MAAGFQLWVYLSTSPLLWLTSTLAAWLAADWCSARSGRHPAVNPVLIAVLLMVAALSMTRTHYETYFAGAQFIHFLLGPATVALAIPLLRTIAAVRRKLVPILAALMCGSVAAIGSAVVFGRWAGLPHETILSLAPKSVTAAVAMGICKSIGGDPALTAVFVILTGITGALVVTPLMDALRIKDYAARGFAVGLASHGIGTARAFLVDPVAGSFAGIAMALNAIVTTLIVPLLL